MKWQIGEKFTRRCVAQLQPQRLVPLDQHLPVQLEPQHRHHGRSRGQWRRRDQGDAEPRPEQSQLLELECAAHPAGAARAVAEGRPRERRMGVRRRVQARRRLLTRQFHREITNWETTSCATDGGNTTSPSGRECAAALAAAGIQHARVAIPNAQLRQLHADLDARSAVPDLRFRRRREQRLGAA